MLRITLFTLGQTNYFCCAQNLKIKKLKGCVMWGPFKYGVYVYLCVPVYALAPVVESLACV
jgi:hypothetical protein